MSETKIKTAVAVVNADPECEPSTLPLQAPESNPYLTMMNRCLESDKGIEKVEKIMELHERWEERQAKKAYHEAMAAFKANPPKIIKDAHVGYATKKGNANYRHATLANVSTVINTALSNYGLSASWKTEQADAIRVTCCITHVLGHQECTSLQASPDNSGSKNAIQAIGSTVTYLERYTILALTGLATHEQDNDAQTQVETISEEQEADLRAVLQEVGRAEHNFCKFAKIFKLSELPEKKYHGAIKWIRENADDNN